MNRHDWKVDEGEKLAEEFHFHTGAEKHHDLLSWVVRQEGQ